MNPATPANNLLGLTLLELQELAKASGEPTYRAQQLFTSIYAHKVPTLTAISNLPRKFINTLMTTHELRYPQITKILQAQDGTRKYRLESQLATDEKPVLFEAVYIPEVAESGKRITNTLCISSQTGCSVNCQFCFTASLKHFRNLTTAEILGQVSAVAQDLKTLATPSEQSRITNIVFMGMGEPLLNYDNVIKAARLLNEPSGLGFSSRRITISTSGIVPKIYELGRTLDTQLAISVNATTDEIRDQIMPINKKWPLKMLLQALRDYPLRERRRFTIEYVLLKDINDSPADAQRLVKILQGIPVKINLLPLNEHAQTRFARPSQETVLRFQHILHQADLSAIIRTTRGEEIFAACGQLGEQPTLRQTPAQKSLQLPTLTALNR